jgi:transcriptional regulator with XRE-family HTH domain
MKLLANNLYFLRRSRQIQQAQIPAILGIPQSSWSNWENGKNNPDIDTLISISNFFEVSLDDLVKTDLQASGQVIVEKSLSKKTKIKPLLESYPGLLANLTKTHPELSQLLVEICESIDQLRNSR